MDFIQVMLIAGAAAGFILVIVSFLKKGGDEIDTRGGHYLEKKLEAMDTTISEADNAISELGGMSRGVLREIDQKYNELLFLYNLIDEKKKEIETAKLAESDEPTEPDLPDLELEDVPPLLPETDKPSPAKKDIVINNPRYAKILELKRQGMTAREIAKELGMGQGEVSLIMSISNNR